MTWLAIELLLPKIHAMLISIEAYAGCVSGLRSRNTMEVTSDEIMPKDLFLQSLDRCSASEGFIPTFYEKFMASSDEVREKFAQTSFEQQNKMLLRSLRLAAGATNGEMKSLVELRERAESHDRHHLDIRPELYDLWLSALLDAACEYDEQWDASIENAWKSVLGFVIHRMTAKY